MKNTKAKIKLKDQKAITLIALVITIIVLLILAGVTIGTLFRRKRNINKSWKCKNTNRDCRRKRSNSNSV